MVWRPNTEKVYKCTFYPRNLHNTVTVKASLQKEYYHLVWDWLLYDQHPKGVVSATLRTYHLAVVAMQEYSNSLCCLGVHIVWLTNPIPFRFSTPPALHLYLNLNLQCSSTFFLIMCSLILSNYIFNWIARQYEGIFIHSSFSLTPPLVPCFCHFTILIHA